MKIEHFDVGDRWTPQATWTVSGTPTDPTQIVVKQQTPDGTESTVTTASNPGSLTSASTPLARMSAGVFKLNPGIQFTTHGYWFVRFEGTGAAEATEEHQAIVDPSEFTSNGGISSRALVGLAETKDWLQQQQINTGEDLELVRAINDISELAHNEADREFKNQDGTSSATARMFPVDQLAYNCRVVEIDDLSAAPTQVRVLGSDWATVVSTLSTSSDIRFLYSDKGAWKPITHIQFRQAAIRPMPGQLVEVTGVWGFPSVPGNLRQAVLDAVAEIMNSDREHWRQDLAPVPAGEGQNIVVLGSRPSFLPVNPRSLSTFQRFRRPQVG